MSSALAIVLMAAMAVPGNGPEKVSEEMEQGLDLSGEWRGFRRRGNGEKEIIFIDFDNGQMCALLLGKRPRKKGIIEPLDIDVVDEGAGAFRWRWKPENSCRWQPRGSCQFGIYKWDNDSLVLCLRESGKGRPTSFHAGSGRHLLILHRVKPRK